MPKVIKSETELSGKKLVLETGKLALQADASVLATWGETVVLVTVSKKTATGELDYFPLSVEYVEKYYASGRITSQKFIKREGRPTEKAVLSGRAIDRSIRPLFPKDYKNEVQVIISVLSYDGECDPALLGFIGTSAALSISTVPWNGPLGVTRIGQFEEKMVVNPVLAAIEFLDLELLVASTSKTVAMIEAHGKQIKDEVVLDGIKLAFKEAQAQIKFIEEFVKAAGKPKEEFVLLAQQVDEGVLKEATEAIRERITKALFDKETPWHESTGDMIKTGLTAEFADRLTGVQVKGLFDKVAKEIVNETVLVKKSRVDGRKMEEVRELYVETGLLPRAHGSALFQRGDTQVLSIATLGPLSQGQILEGMEGEGEKKFMHHYNMGINPFSVGEVKRIGSPNRRDIGHGNLVEISLAGVLPSNEEFPYAVRVVSEVLAANASTSQAAVCATALAMLNAGVPIEPVAGIAMGLLTDHDDSKKFQVITDMRAVEDFYGEMDFKIAGTKNGITGIQMDTKLPGISMEIVEESLKQGKAARATILKKMLEVVPAKIELSKYAPRIEVTHIDPDSIGKLIGSGGKTINGIISKTGAQVDIEDDGTVMISSNDPEAVKAALSEIEGMFKEVVIGDEFEGKVVKVAAFGAFVEILPGRDGMVHVSQMAPHRVEDPSEIVSEGQMVKVRVTEVDSMTGKIGLSMLFGNDIKEGSERRPSGRPSYGDRPSRPSYGGDRSSSSRPSFGDRPARSGFGGGERRGFGGAARGGSSRGGFSDRRGRR